MRKIKTIQNTVDIFVFFLKIKIVSNMQPLISDDNYFRLTKIRFLYFQILFEESIQQCLESAHVTLLIVIDFENIPCTSWVLNGAIDQNNLKHFLRIYYRSGIRCRPITFYIYGIYGKSMKILPPKRNSIKKQIYHIFSISFSTISARNQCIS